MRTYGDDLAQLCLGVARLVDAADRQDPLTEPWRVLAARDAVVRGLSSAYIAVAGKPSRGHDMEQRATVPLQYLSKVLAAEPRLAPQHSAAEAGQLPGTDQFWTLAAGGAVGLEQHLAGSRFLGAADSWTAVGDFARIARALPWLDSDLAQRIQTYVEREHLMGAQRSALQSAAHHLGSTRHDVELRTASGEVLRLIDDTHRTSGAAELHTETRRPLAVRSGQDVPEALRRLAHQLSTSDSVGMRDIVVCCNALRRIAASSEAVLREVGGRTTAYAIVNQLSDVQGELAELAAHRTRVASITQAAGVAVQAQSLANVLHPFQGQDRAIQASEAAKQLEPTVAALTRAVERSSRSGVLLVPWDTAGRSIEQGFWQPALDPESPQLASIRKTAAACRDAARLLPGLASIMRQEHGFLLADDRLSQLIASAAHTVDRTVAARARQDTAADRHATSPRRWRPGQGRGQQTLSGTAL